MTIKAGQPVIASDFIMSLLAGENITAQDAVFIKVSDGKIYKCDADDLTLMDFVGFAQETVTIGNAVTVRIADKMDGFSGLTIGARYYLSGTAGAITSTAPTNIKSVGVAVSATEILMDSYPTVRVVTFTSGGTWTKRPGLKFVEVEVQAGGGGSAGTNGNSGGTGGTSSFGSHLSATGGSGGSAANNEGAGGAGGTGSGGDVNISGGQGGGGGEYPTSSLGIGGYGGSSQLGRGAGQGVGYGAQSSVAGNLYGGGASGPNTASVGGGGGGGGGYSRKVIPVSSLGSTETVTVGAGGTAQGTGAAGGAGIVIVTEHH